MDKKPTIIAVLMTRCGCSRRFVIPYPAPLSLHIPLMPDIKCALNPSESDIVLTWVTDERTFDQVEYGYASERGSKIQPTTIHVLYKERA